MPFVSSLSDSSRRGQAQETPEFLDLLVGNLSTSVLHLMEIRSFVMSFRGKKSFQMLYLYLNSTCGYSDTQPLQKPAFFIWR